MADEEVEEKKSKGGLLKIILFVVGGIVLIAVGLGVGYFVFGSSQPDPSEEIEAIIERKMEEAAAAADDDNSSLKKVSKETPEQENFVTIYYEFPGTFTTNLRGSRKMLQVGIGVSTQYDDTVMMNVESHELALRSTVLGVLSEFAEEEIEGTNGKAALASALKEGINNKLILLENFGGIQEVLFTSFVLN